MFAGKSPKLYWVLNCDILGKICWEEDSHVTVFGRSFPCWRRADGRQGKLGAVPWAAKNWELP